VCAVHIVCITDSWCVAAVTPERIMKAKRFMGQLEKLYKVRNAIAIAQISRGLIPELRDDVTSHHSFSWKEIPEQ